MLANDIIFRNGDSQSILDIHSKLRINYSKDISIGKHVWIGEKAIILKGVELGDNCIVATGSIVTKKFNGNVIVAGNPATIKREGIKWIRERIIK